MLGDDVLAQWRVVDHDARDDAGQVDLGMVGDVPVLLDREWVAADLRITTGFVEPHFFAGFSGGPEDGRPGLAGLATTLELHNARRIGDPRATWGVIEGNPVHDAVRAIAAATGVDFALDVLLDDEQRITRAFGGQILAMHAAACAAGAARGDAAGRAPVRHRRDDQQRLSRSTRTSTRRSRACRPPPRSSDRAARSSAPPSAATASPTTARTGRSCGRATRPRTSWPRIAASPVTHAGPVAGPDPGAGPGQGPGAAADRRPRRRARSGRPTSSRSPTSARPSIACSSPQTRTPASCVLPQGPQTIAYLA